MKPSRLFLKSATAWPGLLSTLTLLGLPLMCSCRAERQTVTGNNTFLILEDTNTNIPVLAHVWIFTDIISNNLPFSTKCLHLIRAFHMKPLPRLNISFWCVMSLICSVWLRFYFRSVFAPVSCFGLKFLLNECGTTHYITLSRFHLLCSAELNFQDSDQRRQTRSNPAG